MSEKSVSVLSSVGLFVPTDQCRAIAIATHRQPVRVIDISIAVLLIRLGESLLDTQRALDVQHLCPFPYLGGVEYLQNLLNVRQCFAFGLLTDHFHITQLLVVKVSFFLETGDLCPVLLNDVLQAVDLIAIL